MRAFKEFLTRVADNGSTPIVLAGQVSPVLEAELDPSVPRAFDAFVVSLAMMPSVRVVREGLPVHTAADYSPGDYMHVSDDARLAYTKALLELLRRDFGLCTK